jgi:ubiquinone/menaquinone biosynthesis C-methylase UbiE
MPDKLGHRADELAAARAFDRQSLHFDRLYGNNTIVRYKRERVRRCLLALLNEGSRILELNAGTGEDAIFLANAGHEIHGTDISQGMLDVLARKAREAGLSGRISHESCSFTQLEKLTHRGPYDLVFSNFAGLNCTGELDKVLENITPLVKPGGSVCLVLLPGFCLWEFLLLFRGKFRTACRRLFSRRGVRAHIEGEYFTCWYYNPSYIRRCLRNSFETTGLEGLCTLVPPSYLEHFAEKYPVLYRLLKKKEERLKNRWPWRCIGDYYIISLKKNEELP